MAKKCSVLKPWRLRNLKLFLSFSCYDFKSTATYLDTDMFKKNLSLVQNFIVSVFVYLNQYIKLRKESEIY